MWNGQPTASTSSMVQVVVDWVVSLKAARPMEIYGRWRSLTSAETSRLHRLAQLHGAFEIDRDQLRDAALRHGDAVEAGHPRHGDRIVRDDDEARVGQPRHLVQQVAEDLAVWVVEP